jgi:hypothetical protein
MHEPVTGTPVLFFPFVRLVGAGDPSVPSIPSEPFSCMVFIFFRRVLESYVFRVHF